jgi:hypothetical protein
MVEYNISEDIVYDLSIPSTESTFELTNTAYDIVIDDLPFVVKVDNQNPYRRETAPYKKDQFDNSPEPGEQSLTGWWLRSQTSWHNGAGITFYEPGTDYQHVSHRFADSRGVDVWTVGEATLLPEIIDVYTGDNLINAAAGNSGSGDVLVSGDSVGGLKRISFSGDNQASIGPTATGYTVTSHTAYPFNSVTTDGTNYYATCSRAIHTGPIGSDSDALAFKFSNSGITNTFIKYAKGFVLLGLGNNIYNMNSLAGGFVPSGSSRTTSSHGHTSGTDTLPSGFKTHINPNWLWNDATASPGPIYISGNAGNNGEVWQIPFDEGTNTIDMPGAQQVISLPDGETVNAIHYYLGVLALGTSKGLRICPINVNNQVILGPLLYENGYYPVNGFTESGNYIYAATKTDNEDATFQHACLIRVDLSTQFDDGSYAFAHDLEYRSSVNETYLVNNKALTTNVATLTTVTAHDFNAGNTVTVSGIGAPFDGTYTVKATPTTTTFTYDKTATNVTSVATSGSAVEASSSSEATEVYQITGRIVMVVEEDEAVNTGELHIESATLKRDTGWFTTGKIRYGMIEPKFFRYINVQCTTGQGDTIQVYTINKVGTEVGIATLSEGLSNQDVFISDPSSKQEWISFKFVLNNVTDDQDLPVLEAYQVKATPATRRQRLYQYPLSCYDNEMDRFNSVFGYSGRALEYLQRIETIEETGKFVNVTDYRTGEQFEGVIEEVRFINESSPDKDSNGFGGLLLVTVRKL